MNNQLFNRKMFFFLMAVVMCLGWTAMSYGAATVSVDPATIESPAVGEQLTVNINIAGGEDVAGYQVTLNFDPTALKYISSAYNADYLAAFPSVSPSGLASDSSIQFITLGAAQDGDGTLATVTFEVVEVKASAITLTDVLISDAGSDELEVTTADGSVTVPVHGVSLSGVGELTTETADAGDGVSYTLRVTNTGNTDDTISLATSGDATATLSQTSISLAADASADVTLTISGDALATAGAYEVKVTATSQGDAEKTAVVSTTTTILPVYGVSLSGVGELTTETVYTGDGVSYMLRVTNTGNTNDTISLTTSGDATATLNQTSISLAAGASADVTLTISDDALATAGAYEVTVTATSQGDAEKTAAVSTTTTIIVPEPQPQMFEITLTNLTTGEHGMGGQIFSPPIFSTHAAGAKIYEVGQPATEALVLLAENGDPSGLAALATAVGANAAATEGLIDPSASVTVRLTADAMNSSLSLATMLVSTNDAFIGVADLPLYDAAAMPISTTLGLRSYDAGSEQNTERGTDIPGPVGLPADADPMGSNARVPTVGGVITPHAGIQGVGDVGEAFAWTEPTALLMITPVVEVPVLPEEPMPPPLPTYDVTFEAGLNMISVPLMPTEPYTAQSLAEMLGSTVVIKLNAATQEFVGYVAGIEGGYNFGIEGGKGYIVNTPTGGTVTFSGTAWANPPAEMPEMTEMAEEDAAAAPKLTTAKDAWAFIITSALKDKETGASYTMVAKNLRTGVVATQKVTSEDGRVTAVWADSNYKSVVEAGDKVEIALLDERGTIVSGPFQRTVQTTDIHNAYMSVQMRVGDVRPKDTILGQNFPNPFNPETWIPYQLSRDTNVTIEIYDVSGHSVRTLSLGHKSTGLYMTSSTAAYWDGKNDAGEPVSSGIYFYVLQTENFSATRRMVILK